MLSAIDGKAIDILGLGVCTLDLLMRVDGFPDAECVVRTNESALTGGGPVATALAAAAQLGASTALLDQLGGDWRGDLIHRELADLGVDMELVRRIPGATSCIASVWVRRGDGKRSIAFAPGSVPELEASQLPPGIVERARILHLNGRHGDAMFEAARRAREAHALVSFDGGANRFREAMRELIPLVDIAIVARDWATRFSHSEDPREAAAVIGMAGPSLVVITDGLAGSWIFPVDGTEFHQPAYPLADAVDTTGCGDVYHGAFLTGIARGWTLSECAAVASAVAALNTRGLGGRGNLVDLATAREFVRARTRRPSP